MLLVAPAAAERAWLKDELRVNLRSGPGLKYRILGSLGTGDAVAILERGERWTQVRPEVLPEGWIPAGYLSAAPPARVALAEREAENDDLKKRLAAVTDSESQFRSAHDEIASRDAARQTEIERIRRENLQLRAGTRWIEWLTGTGIVLFGMALGAIVARGSGRRRKHRIKL
jgi:SH3 domain protein